MFFIMGSGVGNRQLNFDQLIICKACGRYGHVRVVELYSYLSFFFIPLFKWNKRYIARVDCCGVSCELPVELGKEIASGRRTKIPEELLVFQQQEQYHYRKRCTNCGYETEEDFHFCPKCGATLV